MTAICSHLLLAFVTASPVGLVTRSAKGVPDDTVRLVLEGLTAGLKQEGLTVRPLTPGCSLDAACLAAAARENGLAAVVGVTLLKGRRDLALDLEAIDGKGRQLAVDTFSAPLAGAPLPPEAEVFLDRLKRALAPPAEDAPRAVRLEPETSPAPDLVQAPSRGPWVKVSAVTTVASAALGLGCLIAGAVLKGQLDAKLNPGGVTSAISRPEAEARARTVNALGTIGVVSLAITGAAAVTTTVLWLAPPATEEE